MSRKEAVRTFLRNHLDKEIVDLLDFSTLEIKKDTFVDQELGEHFSDILYQLKLRNGQDAKVYVLIEHKSYTDYLVAFQILRYMVRIWELELKQQEAQRKKERKERKEKEIPEKQQIPVSKEKKERKQQEKLTLTPILPIVFYHGEREWQVPLGFQSIFLELPSVLAPYVPDFRYFLYDLTKVDDSEIQGDVILRIRRKRVVRLGLLSLKYAKRNDLPDKLEEIFALFEQLTDHKAAREYLSTLVRYLSSRSTKISRQQLKTALDKKFSEEGETIMATIAETLIEQGREEMRHKMELEMEQQIQKARQEMEEQVQRTHQEAQRAHQEAQKARQEMEEQVQRAHQEAQAEKQRGLLASIELGLELKFGEEGLRLFNEVQQIQETSFLKAIRAALKFVSDLGELRSIYQPALASN
jgi:hypothetical protein